MKSPIRRKHGKRHRQRPDDDHPDVVRPDVDDQSARGSRRQPPAESPAPPTQTSPRIHAHESSDQLLEDIRVISLCYLLRQVAAGFVRGFGPTRPLSGRSRTAATLVNRRNLRMLRVIRSNQRHRAKRMDVAGEQERPHPEFERHRDVLGAVVDKERVERPRRRAESASRGRSRAPAWRGRTSYEITTASNERRQVAIGANALDDLAHAVAESMPSLPPPARNVAASVHISSR